jgi:hypothetical protein
MMGFGLRLSGPAARRGKWDDGFALKIIVARNYKMENFLLNPMFQRSSIPLFHLQIL